MAEVGYKRETPPKGMELKVGSNLGMISLPVKKLRIFAGLIMTMNYGYMSCVMRKPVFCLYKNKRRRSATQ